MTSDRDIDELFRKFAILDAELKELRKEVGEMKFSQTHGGISISKSTIPQWEEGLVKEFNERPPMWPNESHTDYLKRIGQYNEASSARQPQAKEDLKPKYLNLSDTDLWDEEFK